jgi:protein transport protein SEC13
LATCSSDGSVNIYDLNQAGKIIGTFKVYVLSVTSRKESPIWSLSWAHPRFGPVIAVSSYDGEVSVWREMKAGDWAKVAEHTSHQGSVNSIAWAPSDEGLQLASGGSDGI